MKPSTGPAPPIARRDFLNGVAVSALAGWSASIAPPLPSVAAASIAARIDLRARRMRLRYWRLRSRRSRLRR